MIPTSLLCRAIFVWRKQMSYVELIKAAKIIQPQLAQFAGEGGGARVWQSECSSLHALVWSRKFVGVGCTQRQKMVWPHISIPTCLSKITPLTPEEYEERYFFTKPPFCEIG